MTNTHVEKSAGRARSVDSAKGMHASVDLTHLEQLESESIHILRETAAEFRNPVTLYSIGKDSSVMLRLAEKAFFPARPPFPLLHIDTTWKFREMIAFRDHVARSSGLELLVETNQEGVRRGVNPFDHEAGLYTEVMETEPLKAALDKYGFDAAIGGRRRDEEKFRAKERIFSVRARGHQWDPNSQRPELWNIYNTRLAPGQTMRVFPLADWTEIDIWNYILVESVPIIPLYYAAERPVVERDSMLIVVDDHRFRLLPGEKPERRRVRFRNLGCYPLTAAIPSDAATLPAIIEEMMRSDTTERQGRLIDHDQPSSFERKKRDGYF